MNRIISILLAGITALLVFPFGASAQDGYTISGVVSDEAGPVIGASVFEVGTSNGTVTDLDGAYTLKVSSADATVEISCIGYSSVTFKASEAPSRVTLVEDSEFLDDVVVIGYGTVKKSDLTGSISAIKSDDFNKGNQASAQEALIGKIPGVNVVTDGGAPGSGSTIRIRSGSSLSASNDPLIVIDGVPVDNSEINGSGNVIGSINPNDIETFTVLKDASATAIYGSRASNGVIVITTKKGSDKLSVTYSGNFSVSTKTNTLDVLSADEFREFVPTVTGVPSDPDFGSYNTDWQDEVLRTAVGTEHNLSVAAKIRPISAPLRVSLGYTNQNGIIKTNNYQRYTLGFNLAPSLLDDHLKINLNAKVSYEDNQKVDGSVLSSAISYDPTRPTKTGSSTASTDPGLGYYIWANEGVPMAIQPDNPLAVIELEDRTNNVLRTIANASINYKIHGFEDLQLNANLGMDILKSDYDINVPDLAGTMYTSFQKDGTGEDYTSTQKKKNYLLDLYANYDKTLGKHNLGAMVGYGWQHFWRNFKESDCDHLGNEYTGSHYETEYYLLSFYGRVNYSFDNKFLITATLRADASSRFAEDNRWGYFPSVAVAWNIGGHDFFKRQDVMSALKLRLGYGQTGQQDIGNDYPYMTTFSVSYDEARYRFGDTWYNTYRPNGYDSGITWETTTTYNVGLDFGFFDNRLTGTVDVYKRYTKDLLNTINVISGTNYSSVITTNIGKMENQGVEIALEGAIIRNRDWDWTLGVNYTWNDSEITKLNVIDDASNFVTTGDISGTGKYVQVFMVGKRPYTFYLAQQAYDDNGDAIEGYYVQEDGSVSTTETRVATDKCALPKSYLGLNTHLSYKNWELAISGHGSFGHYIYNYVRADEYKQQVYSDQGYYSNILRSTAESGFELQQLYSDIWLEKGNFFRIDNITLGYTFNEVCRWIDNIRVSANVSNICTFSGYSGLDPEIYNGIDRNVYPRPRVYTIGVNIEF